MSENVPTELWYEIFNYVDYPTLQKLKTVCRQFDSIISTKKLDGLTPQIWTQIFEYLDYMDLKVTIPATSKTFRCLVKNATSPIIDATLFREKLDISDDNKITSKITINSIVTQHPIFEKIYHNCATNIKRIGFRQGSRCPHCQTYHIPFIVTNFIPLVKTDIGSENATSPPATRVVVEFGYAKKATLNHGRRKNPTPVTVMDVLIATCKRMGRVLPDGTGIYRDLQTNRTIWVDGFSVSSFDDGTVLLDAREFEYR